MGERDNKQRKADTFREVLYGTELAAVLENDPGGGGGRRGQTGMGVASPRKYSQYCTITISVHFQNIFTPRKETL